jgi:hypothetical protein
VACYQFRILRISLHISLFIAAVTASTAIAACGSSAPKTPASAQSSSRQTSAEAQASGLSYARCMRAHGISRFPDPSPSGGFDFHASGLDLSSPAFKAAETACQSLLPEKHPPTQQPTARAYARLLSWAKCMRRHAISLPDPKPDPVPGPGSAATSRFGTVMGDGGYWVGIPYNDNAHSPAFARLSTRCGESPSGPVRHHH